MVSIPVPETPCIQCIRKPSWYICDLQSIDSATGFANHSAIPDGLQVPVDNSQQRDEDIDEELTLVVDVGDIEPLEPKSLNDAKWHLYWPSWECGICKEIKTLEDSSMWELADAPLGVNIVRLKWVFHLKCDAISHLP